MADAGALVCRSCGATTRHAFVPRDDLVAFTCRGCGQHHDLGARVPTDGYVEKAAKLLGGTVFAHSLLVTAAGRDVEVSIDFNSGIPYAVVLHARTPALPAVTLSSESRLDRRGRELGISHEVQLGDPAFDPKVWIDAALPDDVVLALLRAPEARRAVLAILATERDHPATPLDTTVRLGAEGVIAKVGMSTLDDERALRAAVEALAALAGSVQPDPAGAARAFPPRRRVQLAFFLAVMVGLGALPIWYASREHPPLFAVVAPYFWGLGAGFVVWLFLAVPVLWLLIRGRSSSLGILVAAVVVWHAAIEVDASFLPVLLNWALDGSPRVARRTQVVSLPRRVDDANVGLVVRSWRDGGTLDIGQWGLDEVRPGAPIVLWTRRGFFGWEWLEATSIESVSTPPPPKRR